MKTYYRWPEADLELAYEAMMALFTVFIASTMKPSEIAATWRVPPITESHIAAMKRLESRVL